MDTERDGARQRDEENTAIDEVVRLARIGAVRNEIERGSAPHEQASRSLHFIARELALDVSERTYGRGSDAVGRFGDYPDQIRIYDALFDAIGDREVVEALAHGNFLRIMPKEGITLDAQYMYPEERYSQRRAAPQPSVAPQ